MLRYVTYAEWERQDDEGKLKWYKEVHDVISSHIAGASRQDKKYMYHEAIRFLKAYEKYFDSRRWFNRRLVSFSWWGSYENALDLYIDWNFCIQVFDVMFRTDYDMRVRQYAPLSKKIEIAERFSRGEEVYSIILPLVSLRKEQLRKEEEERSLRRQYGASDDSNGSAGYDVWDQSEGLAAAAELREFNRQEQKEREWREQDSNR